MDGRVRAISHQRSVGSRAPTTSCSGSRRSGCCAAMAEQSRLRRQQRQRRRPQHHSMSVHTQGLSWRKCVGSARCTVTRASATPPWEALWTTALGGLATMTVTGMARFRIFKVCEHFHFHSYLYALLIRKPLGNGFSLSFCLILDSCAPLAFRPFSIFHCQ